MEIKFKLLGCPTDFDTRPFIEINRKTFADIAGNDTEIMKVEKELSEACTVLTNQTNAACEERGENARVFNVPMYLNNCTNFRPVKRLTEMCSKVGDGFKVYIGYKKYAVDNKNYYCPQIRLCDKQEEFTMYEVLKAEVDEKISPNPHTVLCLNLHSISNVYISLQ